MNKELLALWEHAICEIRSEIKATGDVSLIYAKELCDKLETSIVAFARGDTNSTQFTITD